VGIEQPKPPSTEQPQTLILTVSESLTVEVLSKNKNFQAITIERKETCSYFLVMSDERRWARSLWGEIACTTPMVS